MEDEYNTDDSLTNEDLSDDMFLDLVKALQQYGEVPIPQLTPNKTTGTKKKVPNNLIQKKTNVVERFLEKSRSNSSLPSILVFEAISFHFSGSCTTEKVITRYQNLTSPKE